MVVGTIGLSSALYCRKLPKHIEDHPDGCCARSCCGRRIMRKHNAELESKKKQKKEFLMKIDKQNIKRKKSKDKKTDEDHQTKKKASCLHRCCCCLCSCCSCWQNSTQRNKVLLVLLFINIGFGFLGFFRALVQRPDMNRSFYFAKAGGSMLNFDCAAIFLPVARNMLSWLRTTPIGTIIPLDSNILFHKAIAFGILVGASIHIIGHYFNFWAIAAESGATSSSGLVGILQLSFGSWHGITGHAIMVMMVCMYSTAGERCRRGTFKLCGMKPKCCGGGCGYNVFWETHKMWLPVTIILLLHGQNYWIYALWPICLMVIEKSIRKERAKHRMRVVEVKSLGRCLMLGFCCWVECILTWFLFCCSAVLLFCWCTLCLFSGRCNDGQI